MVRLTARAARGAIPFAVPFVVIVVIGYAWRRQSNGEPRTTALVALQLSLVERGVRDVDEGQVAGIGARALNIAGVTAVAWSAGLPPTGGAARSAQWGISGSDSPPVQMTVYEYLVSADMFRIHSIPLLRGRTFRPADTSGDVIVSEGVAAKLWPQELSPIDKIFWIGHERLRVVGLAREVPGPFVDGGRDAPELYRPFKVTGEPIVFSIVCEQPCSRPRLVESLSNTLPSFRIR
jgi:hypothetical protein